MRVTKSLWAWIVQNGAALAVAVAVAFATLWMVVSPIKTVGPDKGPTGRVTNKMWVQEFWQAGEQLYPARWCLELNYRDEVCIPESNWNKYSVGDWYK